MQVEICGTIQIVPDGTDVSGKPWCKVLEEPQSRVVEEPKNKQIRSGDKIMDLYYEKGHVYVAVEFFIDNVKYVIFVSITNPGTRLTEPYKMKNTKYTTLDELYNHMNDRWEFQVISD